MKKIFAFLLALCLPICACAETVKEQVGAPEHTTGEWYSKTGLTCITVDADVIVPDVERIATYAVTGRDVTAEDAKNMASAAAPETDWEQDWMRVKNSSEKEWTKGRDEANEIYEESTGNQMRNYIYIYELDGDKKASVGSYNWHISTVFGEKRILAQTSYDSRTNKYLIHMIDSEPIDIADDMKLPEQSATLAESRTAAEAVAKAVCPEMSLWRSGKVMRTSDYENNVEVENRRYAYWFGFTRVLDGVPVTQTNQAALSDPDQAANESYETSPKCESLFCVVDQGKVVYADLLNPWAIGEVRQEEVTLLPFETIMDIFGTVAPLSIQHNEVDPVKMNPMYSNGWQITEIRLGYAPVLLKNGGGTWELHPVWDFMGIHTSPWTYDDRTGNVALTIDAVDGTVIDREYGY